MKASFKFTGVITFLPVFLSLLIITTFPAYAELPVIENSGRQESPFAKVYEKVAPTVVTIDVTGKIESNTQANPFEFFFNVPEQSQKREYSGMGSGVIVDIEGHILTNNHVITKPDGNIADKITVTLNNNDVYEAELVGRDPKTDLAIIKIKLDGKLLPPQFIAELGDSDTLKPGDYAIAIGNPLGLQSTITIGVISAIGRSSEITNPYGADQLLYKNFIQTDAQINPGNSGGALSDIDGKVIGINDMYAGRYAGIGFAIPINLAKNVKDQLIATGEIKRGFVGLKGEDISKDIQEAMGLSTTEGCLINEVLKGYPAEKAGIQHGDIIVSVNGHKIKDYNDFRFKIAEHSPGETVKIGIIQKNEKKTVSLTLVDLDEYLGSVAQTGAAIWRGIHVINIGDADSQRYNLGDIDSGVVIVNIEEDSPASETTLAEGDIVVEINHKQIKNVDDFLEIKNQLKDSKKAILIYRRRVTSSGRIVQGYVAVKSD